MAITHFDEAESDQADLGHLRSRWTYLGDGAESVRIGVNRIEVADGYWATPAHEHGGEEEIFYVLAGEGILWLDGKTAAISAGDCISFPAERGAHTVHGVAGFDFLAFGMRCHSETVAFPRPGFSRIGSRVVETDPGMADGYPAQWLRESEVGPPDLGESPGPRPPSVVNVRDVEPERTERDRIVTASRNLGRATGSERVGLRYVEVAPEKENEPPHCHSLEEEIFVGLDGNGILVLDEEEIDVRAGTVVARPAGTGVSHMFRAGAAGLTYLAYGTRETGDVCYYPRSNKISFRGVGVIARIERLEYWDGED